MQKRQLLATLLCAAWACTGLSAMAQVYPTKPITMVVPFPPGGVADTVGRPVAEAMSRHLKQSIVVENKGGAGGGIAPLYETHQLKPVARFTADPTVLVVRADSPWKTYADFIAYAKTHPGRISFGSSGNYGTMHVPMEQLKAATSTFMLHVPYTGAGPAVLSLIGGQIEALSTGPASVKQHIASGRLRALAHWGDGRLASMPEVPSFKELGVPIQYSQWAGMFVPADTPSSVVDSLRQAARFAAQDPRAVAALTAAGTSFMYQDAPEFERFVQADGKEMSVLVKRIGKVD